MKEIIQQQIETWTAQHMQSEGICRYGDGWQYLSRAEEEIFTIPIDTWPRLLACWMAYEAVRGAYDHGLDRATQRQFKEYRLTQDWLQEYADEESFWKFGEKFGFTYRELSAVFGKQHFLNVRSGGLSFPDETVKHRAKKTLNKILQFPLSKARQISHS